ncbi:MAG: dipeptidase [bacterium]|nr:dipeptidase [bacterium]
MSNVDTAIEFVRARHDLYIEELTELLAMPSISTLPEHKADVEQVAHWLADRLAAVGMHRAEIIATPGHPVVYAEWLNAPDKPTVLVYGHYDVQPVDPIDEWDSPPFEATVRGENIHARGASDMKGQFFAHLKALEALAAHGGFPVNLKYMLEGEEEIGSPNLEAFIQEHKDMLECDFVLNCDAGILAPDKPGIVYALRGLSYFEVDVRGPSKDLHSGLFGGVVQNPLNVLCSLIAGMIDEQGRVTLPGFYDDVLPLTQEERDAIAKAPFGDSDYLAMSGAPALWGEEGFTALERVGARPTLDVNGIVGGFTGDGAKTVLPARAMVKISTRLVANQKPEAVYDMLCAYMKEHAPDTITWEVRALSYGPSAIMDRHSKWMNAAVASLREVFDAEPIFKREGGSVPVVGILQQMLDVDSVMLGFAMPDDGVHGPNEKQHLPTLFRGIETYIRFLTAIGT